MTLKQRKTNKSDFIRKYPNSTPASLVQKAGEARGMKFSTNFVYTVRAKAKAKKLNGASPLRLALRLTASPSPSRDVDALVSAFVRDLRKAIVLEIMEGVGAAG